MAVIEERVTPRRLRFPAPIYPASLWAIATLKSNWRRASSKYLGSTRRLLSSVSVIERRYAGTAERLMWRVLDLHLRVFLVENMQEAATGISRCLVDMSGVIGRVHHGNQRNARNKW